jgi:hypothetical protein
MIVQKLTFPFRKSIDPKRVSGIGKAKTSREKPKLSAGHPVRRNLDAGSNWREEKTRPLAPLVALLVVAVPVSCAANRRHRDHALCSGGPGIWEADPQMAFSQAKLGAAWWLPKLMVVGFICLATPWSRKRWPTIFVISYYSVIVCGTSRSPDAGKFPADPL